MAYLSRKQIVENCEKEFHGMGSIRKCSEDLESGRYDTTLTGKGVRALVSGQRVGKFEVLIHGWGWCTFYPLPQDIEDLFEQPFDFEKMRDAEDWAHRKSLIFDTDEECQEECLRLLNTVRIRERDE